MNKLFLDIETFSNKNNLKKEYVNWKLRELVNKSLKDKEKIEADIAEKSKSFALDARTGMVIMVGMRYYDTDKKTSVRKEWFNETGTLSAEKRLLEESTEFLISKLAGGARLVTFNGKTFDIPFIVKRCLINNVMPKNLNVFAGTGRITRKYYNDAHYDIWEVLGGGSAGEWGYLLGLKKSPESKGNEIDGLYREKKFSIIKSKNREDLDLLETFYNHIKYWYI